MPHQILKVQPLYEGWGRYLKLTIRLPDGDTVEREMEDHGSAVVVLPYDPERRVATLVRLFRAPPFHVAGVPKMLEAPAGILEEDDPAACARREAMEEVGLELGALEPIGALWTMPGISTERMHFYLASYTSAQRKAAGGGLAEEHEHIEVTEMPLAELVSMAERGVITDVKTLLLVQTLRLRRPELFEELP